MKEVSRRKLAIGNTEIDLVIDPNCPPGTFYMLDPSQMLTFELFPTRWQRIRAWFARRWPFYRGYRATIVRIDE